MTQLARSLIAAVVLLGLAGCGGTSAEPEAPPTKKTDSALANLDPCDIMAPQQLKTGGFEFTERVKQFDSEPGCAYDSRAVGLTIYKNQSENIQSYKKNGHWSKYDFIKVNDREGASGRSAGDTEDSCSTLVPAGGGVILVSAFSADPRQPVDGCAESMKIAKRIEPNLPE